MKNNQALLHFHQKLQKYLPPGGHIEENETPIEAVRREILEETGLTVEIISDENITTNYSHAKSFHRPYLCLLENIPAHKDQPPHQHIDLIYIAKPIGEKKPLEEFSWYFLEEIQSLSEKNEIFPDVLDVLTKLLKAKDPVNN